MKKAIARFKSCIFTTVVLMVLLSATSSHAILKKTTEMAQMPDGIRLATDIYLPEKEMKIPAVLIRTTYGRSGMANMLLPIFEGKNIALVIQDTRGAVRF